MVIDFSSASYSIQPTAMAAAQAYLQHYEKKHLKGRKRNRAEHPRTPDVHDGKYGKKA